MTEKDVEVKVRFIGNVSSSGSFEKLLCQMARSFSDFSIHKTYNSKIGKSKTQVSLSF